MRYVPSRVMRAKYVMYRVMRICCSVMGWLLSVGDEVVSGEGGRFVVFDYLSGVTLTRRGTCVGAMLLLSHWLD